MKSMKADSKTFAFIGSFSLIAFFLENLYVNVQFFATSCILKLLPLLKKKSQFSSIRSKIKINVTEECWPN